MKIKRLFCIHHWIKPQIQRIRYVGMFGFSQYEWKCKKYNKIKWSDYENIPPEPNMV